ncbi:MAG: leucine-rich repeat domain-containing protein, partial [Clostridia bacterium]|nr:leucine-rich repeat domain-containing protein [Clostridia bacterium]
YAFRKTGLYGDIVLKGEEIGEGAFSETEITSVTIPENYEEIPVDCFSKCLSLKEVTLSFADKTFGEKFAYCPIEKINFEDTESAYLVCGSLVVEEEGEKILVLGSGESTSSDEVTAIGSYAFSGRKFTEERLEFKVNEVGEYAFTEVEAVEICIDASGAVGNYCFSRANVNAITVKAESIGSYALYCDAKKISLLSDNISSQFLSDYGDSFSYDNLKYVKNVEEIEFLEGCKEIKSGAFAGCRHLKKITLPASLQVIGYGAFANCNYLNEVYYNLREGTPAQMNADCFYCIQDPAGALLNGQSTLRYIGINEGFKIYVYESVADACKKAWKEKTVHFFDGRDRSLPSLASKVKIRED